MNKTILSLLIFILLISLNLKAETFSMFGLEIGSKLDDSYKGGGKGGSWTGPITSGCADDDTSTY
jgi:hypothetical protein